MALKRLDHMNDNMRKHLNGRCVMVYSPIRPDKSEKSKKEHTQLKETGEAEKCLKK